MDGYASGEEVLAAIPCELVDFLDEVESRTRYHLTIDATSEFPVDYAEAWVCHDAKVACVLVARVGTLQSTNEVAISYVTD